jgi:two-component system sensor histidine kinase DegS
MQVLLEEARAISSACLAEQASLRNSASEIAARIAELEAKLAERPDSDMAMEIVAMRERQRTLEQQSERTRESCGDWNTIGQRLRLAIREGEAIITTLTAEGPVREDRGRAGSVAWHVAQAQENERERLAREIHDSPAQALANAIFELEFCERLLEKDPAKLRQELVRLKNDMRGALADVRHFIFGLRPAALSELGLTATIRRYADDFRDRSGILVELEMGNLRRLHATQEVAVFRIVQEAFQNARKHSRAKTVRLSLSDDEDRLRVAIEDDGQGFERQKVSQRCVGHFGLQGMQERAALIGGQLEIESRPGAGTKVTLNVPIQAIDSRD